MNYSTYIVNKYANNNYNNSNRRKNSGLSNNHTISANSISQTPDQGIEMDHLTGLAQREKTSCQPKRRYHFSLSFIKAYLLRYIRQNTRLLTLERDASNQKVRKAELGNSKGLRAIITHGIPEIEDRIITIAFWDIQGFSTLCYSLEINPVLLTLFLKEFFDTATQIILDHGGIVDKFLGDGVMALFGTDCPRSYGHDGAHSAISAVSAAIEFRERFRILKIKWTGIWQKYIPSQINVGLKCGLNTGYATVGNIGTKKYDHFTAVGATVNLADRLANLSNNDEIIISVTTKSKILNNFELQELGVVGHLKNIPGRFEIYSVIKKKDC
jgi:class 3 adenylate cyclase